MSTWNLAFVSVENPHLGRLLESIARHVSLVKDNSSTDSSLTQCMLKFCEVVSDALLLATDMNATHKSNFLGQVGVGLRQCSDLAFFYAKHCLRQMMASCSQVSHHSTVSIPNHLPIPSQATLGNLSQSSTLGSYKRRRYGDSDSPRAKRPNVTSSVEAVGNVQSDEGELRPLTNRCNHIMVWRMWVSGFAHRFS